MRKKKYLKMKTPPQKGINKKEIITMVSLILKMVMS